MSEQRRGVALGAAAYLMWGVFPLYFPLLEPAGAFEILAHRIVWSLVCVLALVVVLRRTPVLLSLLRDRRRVAILAIAAALVSINWGTFIWATTNEHVVEVSLGYFINPLVTMLLGVFVLGERLRSWQWLAVGIAVVAVLVLAIDYGRPPWVSLAVAFSFGFYGLAKKQANAPAVEALAVETAVLAPVALVFIGILGATGHGHLTTEGPVHVLLLAIAGLLTLLPLLCFGAAATRIPMFMIGLLQYIAPTMQFMLGVFLLGENMTTGRWIGFVIVWIALAIFSYEALAHRRRQLRDSAEACAI